MYNARRPPRPAHPASSSNMWSMNGSEHAVRDQERPFVGPFDSIPAATRQQAFDSSRPDLRMATFAQAQQRPTSIDAPGLNFTTSSFALQAPSQAGRGRSSSRVIPSFSTGYLPASQNQSILDHADHALRRPGTLSQDVSQSGFQSYDHTHSTHTHNPSKRPLSYDEEQEDEEYTVEHSQSPETELNVAAKSREERRKIVSTVVIACRQCRGRKIRCDSTRPVCNNCVRRSDVCEYDAAPKRRGPDKRPGTRQRQFKKKPTTIENSATSSSPSGSASSTKASTTPRAQNIAQGRVSKVRKKTEIFSASESPTTRDFPPLGVAMPPQHHHRNVDHTSEPWNHMMESAVYLHDPSMSRETVQSTRSPVHSDASSSDAAARAWWDEFLLRTPVELIASEIEYLFRDTEYHLAFLNLPLFLRTLWHPEDRVRSIRPVFILAAMAMATLMKSSEFEGGLMGRDKALWYRNEAEKAMEQSYASGERSVGMAQAALILTLFESSAHPGYSPRRELDSIMILDRLLRELRISMLDFHDHGVTKFMTGTVPATSVGVPIRAVGRCSCIPPESLQPPDPYNTWSYLLPWGESWSIEQIRQEESRRLCWSALGLVSSYTAAQAAEDATSTPSFWLCDPSNYAVLFPGEVLDRTSLNGSGQYYSAKESVWALYCRSMLLWVFCYQFDALCPNGEEAQLARDAWNESDAIQESLDLHICNLDTAILYTSKEYVFNSRLALKQVLRSLSLPGLVRRSSFMTQTQARQWIMSQSEVMKRVNSSIVQLRPDAHHVIRRPYQTPWFITQFSICVDIWCKDTTLFEAYDLAKEMVAPVEVMLALWKCPHLEARYADLYDRFHQACLSVGQELPARTHYTLPI